MPVLAPDASKAATLDGQDVVHAAIADIAKWEDGPDGSLYVYGRATTPEVDTDEQVISSDFSGHALKAWLDEAPALRVQHNGQRDPAGSGIKVELNRDGDGAHWVKAVVDEPGAQRLVRKGHLRAFSVGIARPVIERDVTGKARGGIINGGRIVEVSLVDSPANRSCFLEIARANKSGQPEFTGTLTAPEDVLAKVAAPAKSKTVTVDLPKGITVGFSPRDLAKLVAHRQQAQDREDAAAVLPAPVTKAAGPAPAPDPDAALKAVGAAEDAILGKKHREFSAGERREQAKQGNSLPDGSYPIPDADALRRAAILAQSGHGNVAAAKKLIARRAGELGVPNPLKAKAEKSAKPKCGTCGGKGMDGEKPCGDCKSGKRKAMIMRKKEIAKALTPGKAAAPDVEKKERVACGSCGAMQNKAHNHCTECGKSLAGAMPVEKNHDHMCTSCGKALDKGERYCPGCGKEHPGYLPEADHKIPANQDKAAAVPGPAAPAVTKKKRGKGGSKPTPGKGVVGKDGEKPAAVHREPDGSEVEAFERDSHLEDGDQRSAAEQPTALEARTMKGSSDPEIAASLALKALGVSPQDGALHALTCAAYSPEASRRAFPSASFAALDLTTLQEGALEKAAGGSMAEAQAASGLLQAAAVLRSTDPWDLADLQETAHKSFRDANPGPATFPVPGQISAERFNHPYLEQGRAAPSPGQDPPHHVALPPLGGIQPGDYDRSFLAEGRAADSPANSHQAGPMPAPERTGVPTSGPARTYYRNSAREQAMHAMRIVHDHIAATHPDLCPMGGGDHVASRPVPVPQGVPEVAPAPGGKKGKKAEKAAARKAARKMASKRRRLSAQVLKGSLSVEDAQRRLGITPQPAEFGAPMPVPGTDVIKAAAEPDAITVAVTQATAPLAAALAKSLKKQARQDKALRRQRKVLDAIASSPDTSAAPFRGVTAVKAAAPAAPLHAPPSQADPMIPYLMDTVRNSPDPGEREAAWATLRQRTWDKGMTPEPQGQQGPYAYPLPT